MYLAGHTAVLVAAATRHGCHGVGYELDGELVRAANSNVAKAKVDHLVTIIRFEPSSKHPAKYLQGWEMLLIQTYQVLNNHLDCCNLFVGGMLQKLM